ncbi:hypothetical protein PTKIN_Ptkin09bG0021300 [Pterospermum kingtungense]
MVIQDEEGAFVSARVLHFEGQLVVKEAEAACLLDAMRWVRLLGNRSVEFESDAKCVVDALHSYVLDVTEFGSILNLCRVILVGENNFRLSLFGDK